jgi:hypothetical protein
VLFTTDEQTNAPLASYDISDLSNITLLDQYYTLNMPSREVHNVRVLDDFLINPSYGSQLTIADAARPSNIIETASYPTGSFLCWDADPYLASGAIMATDMNSGTVFLFQPTYVRACYLEGLVRDSVTGAPLVNVDVIITGNPTVKKSLIDGSYATGMAQAGTYSVVFSKNGYASKTISGVLLQSGLVTSLDVELAPSNIGINEVDALAAFNLHPLPANDRLLIDYPFSRTADYVITDISGQSVMKGSLSGGAFSSYAIETSLLPSGIYCLTILMDGSASSGRFAVTH